jgi:hypothetical protein
MRGRVVVAVAPVRIADRGTAAPHGRHLGASARECAKIGGDGRRRCRKFGLPVIRTPGRKIAPIRGISAPGRGSFARGDKLGCPLFRNFKGIRP